MRRLQHHACLALWAGLNEFSEVFVTFSFLNQATMRTRQPFDKTGTKQIPCFKLTSKQYILWCQPITKSARNQLESLVYEVLLSSERTTLPFMWTQWRRLQFEKIPRDSSLCQGFSVLNLKVFKLNFNISSPSNGVASEEAGYIADNPQSSLWGDTHHYDYKWNDYKSKQSSIPWCFDLRSNNWEWQNYPKTRFASEYGFQAFPAFSVLEPVGTYRTSFVKIVGL